MKQAVELPTLKELVALLAENYWKANNAELPKELLTLKEATSSLESLAIVAKKLNTKTAFYTPKPHFRELYTLIMVLSQLILNFVKNRDRIFPRRSYAANA